MDKIDFVVTWVDGSDPAWLAEKSKYSPKEADIRKSRYRDWNQLKYWFRAVEKFAPWVNKIHFVTYGHLPKWLDINNPKLHIVKHEDFIPKEYLPVFNSTAIEVHIHKIPGLADQFVYFCDDMYLMRPCKPTDFFRKGKPADMPVFEQIPVNEGENGEKFYYHQYNNYSIYRQYFQKKDILKNMRKFVNLKYGKDAISNFSNIIAKNLFIASFHNAIPLLKTNLEIVWRDHPGFMRLTAESKFRNCLNVSLDSVRGYQLITGNFVPIKRKGIVLSSSDPKATKVIIESQKYKYLCISDNSTNDHFEKDKEEINQSFELILPKKSSFEL